MKKKLSVSLVVVLALLLVTSAFSVPAKGGNKFFGTAVWLLTGGLECEGPKAVFTVDKREGEAPLTVNFDASSSEAPNGTIEEYRWAFGDGSTDYGEKVSHTFYDPGNYTVELTVEDDDRNEDSYTRSIEVDSSEQDPVASFDASPTSGEAPLKVSLDASASSDPDGSIVEYEWDFGDGGGVTGKKVSHTYENAGDYTVTLTVTDDDNRTDTATKKISVSEKPKPNEDPVAKIRSPEDGSEYDVSQSIEFSGCDSYDPDGDIVKYHWDFGDGSSGTGQNIHHSYGSSGSYEVELTVTDDDEATDTTSITVNIKSEDKVPVAKFSASPTDGEVPLKVNFDASGSYDPDGSIVSYSWNYDNGDVDSGRTTSYTFNSAGTYTVELQVKDNDNNTDTTTIQITVNEPENEPPVAEISANPTSGEVPLEVDFYGSNSNDPDGSIASYHWQYGDGATDSGADVSHTYNSAGTYTVKLKVTDDDGATDTATKEITVEEPSNKPPQAQLNASPTSGGAPLQVSFDASDSSDPDGNIVSYDWDFGSGATGSGKTTSYTYNNSGTYDATVTVTDNDGDTDTASTQIDVGSDPPEDKDVILSLAQGRPVSYGEWFELKIDGYGNEGQVDILHNGNVNQVDFQAISPWQANISRPSTDRISIEFWNGGDDYAIRPILKMKMSGSSKSCLELTNAQVLSGNYEMNLTLIGNKIE